MASDSTGLEDAIRQAMAAVRGSRWNPDTADTVDAALDALRARAEGLGSGDAITGPLGEAQAAYGSGDVPRAVQRLSHALIQVTRLPPKDRERRR